MRAEFRCHNGLRYSYYDKTMIFREWESRPKLSLVRFLPKPDKSGLGGENGLYWPQLAIYRRPRIRALSPAASASYKFTPDVMGYSPIRGRRGGAQTRSQICPLGAPTTVKPENLDNYEVGLKSAFFDQRLQVNLAPS